MAAIVQLNAGNLAIVHVSWLFLFLKLVFPTLAQFFSIKGLLKRKHFRGHFLTWLLNQGWPFYLVELHTAWVTLVDQQPHRKCKNRTRDVNSWIKRVWVSVFIGLPMGCKGYLGEILTWHFFHLYPGRILQCFTLGSSKNNSLIQ